MDTTLLAVFGEVARQGSFTGAAEALGYTQSAVSRQISALEKDLGAELFDRLPRGVRLTPQGDCLLPHAQAVIDRLGTALDDLRALRDLAAGRLRVGAFPTADVALVPRAVAAFRAAHPKITLTLAEGFVRRHVARLHAGDLDLAVLTAAAPAVFDGLDLRHLLDDQMLVAMHPSHPLAGRRTLRLAELADEEWIAGSSRPEETLISSALHAGFQPRITYVIGEWIAKQGMVAAGLGITLIPSIAASTVRPDIALAALHPDDSPVRSVFAATPHGRTGPPATTAFIDFLAQAAVRLREVAVQVSRGPVSRRVPVGRDRGEAF
jgi:DNA-binding transcriptional LysR family regulator